MRRVIFCPFCQTRLRLPRPDKAHRNRCPKCKNRLTLPAPGAAAPAPELDVPESELELRSAGLPWLPIACTAVVAFAAGSAVTFLAMHSAATNRERTPALPVAAATPAPTPDAQHAAFDKLVEEVRAALGSYSSEELPANTDTKIAGPEITGAKVTLNKPAELAVKGQVDEHDAAKGRIDFALAADLTVHAKQPPGDIPGRARYRVEAEYAFVAGQWRLGEVRLVLSEAEVAADPPAARVKKDLDKSAGQAVRLSPGSTLALVRILGAPGKPAPTVKSGDGRFS